MSGRIIELAARVQEQQEAAASDLVRPVRRCLAWDVRHSGMSLVNGEWYPLRTRLVIDPETHELCFTVHGEDGEPDCVLCLKPQPHETARQVQERCESVTQMSNWLLRLFPHAQVPA